MVVKRLRGIAKQFVPYGLMGIWLKRHYGVVQDKPLLFYPGLAKRLRRLVKFSLPYGLVMKVKQPGPADNVDCPVHPMLVARTSTENLRLLKPRVLIVAELSIPQCRYYRVEQKRRMLEQAGIAVDVDTWIDSNSCLGRLQLATAVIFYRVPYTAEVQKLYAEAHRLGLKVGFDIDDLVFDIDEYSQNSNLRSLPLAEQKSLLEGAKLYQQALSVADYSIASTRGLQSYMRRYCKGASYIVPNCILHDERDDGERFPLGRDGRIVIGYGSGTSTHNEDFKLCAEAVLRILREFPNVVFVLHGILELPHAFDEFKDRIIRVDFVPFEEYSRAVARFDINLIPLEGGTFNDCKSNIKFLEASKLGVPSVSSPLAEFRLVIRDGENGFLAATSDEWYRAIRQLVLSSDLRARIGRNARKAVLAAYDSLVVAERQLLPLLKEQQLRPAKKRKRILVVNVLYPPTSFGGATVLCENMVAEYRKMMDVCVFTMTMDVRHWPGHMTRYENRGEMCVQVEQYPPSDPTQNWDVEASGPAFKAVCDAFLPDLVHFHSIQFLGLQLVEYCQSAKIPYVITAHDAWWICERQFMLDCEDHFCAQDELGIDLYRCAECTKSKALFTRWHRMQRALSGAVAVLTPSDYQTDLYNKSCSSNSLARTNRNGIPVPAIVAPHKLHAPITFAYLAGKCQHKGYFFLQHVVAKLKGDYRLKLVDLDLKFGKRSIKAEEWKHGDKIEICRPFDHHGMDEFYDGIDVLLFPSCWKESFGLTVREALARNIWVIATRAGGDLEQDLVGGTNGDLVEMFDEEGFAAAMQRLINDPTLLDGFENPRRGMIRTPVEQAREALEIIRTCLERTP